MSSNKKSLAWVFALIAVTIIPAIVILYNKNKNNFRNSAAPRPMWPMGLKENGSKDTLYFKLPDFKAQNADTSWISTSDMDGKLTVVETFFSTCQSICPIMNKNMARVFSDLSHNKDLQFYSYTVDPERDSLSTLRRYAELHGADLNQWRFLRAPQDSIFNFGRFGLKIPVGEGEEVGNFLHSERFVLVDWNRNIRGYYDGTDSISVNKMMNHIVLLLSEKERIARKNKH